MPSFSRQVHNPTRYAQFDVNVGVHSHLESALKSAKRTVPAAVAASAIIDTGATHTCIPFGIAGGLGLTPVDQKMFGTASQGGVPCWRYAMRIFFPGGQFWEGIVAEMPQSAPGKDILIGCDVLAFGVLIYNGPTKAFTLCF